MTTMLRVAIVGAGPAGLYCADALRTQSNQPVHIDLFDALPTPYGLLRGGVAPDHQKMKQLDVFYEKIITKNELTQYYGNITIGRDVTIQTLKNYYDAIILSYGAATAKPLMLPGHDLPGHIAATDLVGWYNGHPDYATFQWDQTARHIAVLGQGNVALDIVRLLAKTRAELSLSDMPESVINCLSNSNITDIHLIGRRGPAQAAFTPLELTELGHLSDCDVLVNPGDLVINDATTLSRKSQKNLTVLHQLAEKSAGNHDLSKSKRLHIHFFRQPHALHGDGKLRYIDLAVTKLVGDKAVPTGDYRTLAADCVIRSIGYKGTDMPGVPFDSKRGIIPNCDGRVTDAPGLYVSGWIKRGPTGVIGSNKPDAIETVQTLLADANAQTLVPAVIRDTTHLLAVIRSKGIKPVLLSGWQKLDAEERQRGQVLGKPREKFITWDDLIKHTQ